MAVLAPMPSARDRMTTIVKPGLARSTRIAYRTSRHVWSIHSVRRVSRHASFRCLRPPNARRAARIASSFQTPIEVGLDLPIEMKVELLVELLFDTSRAEQRATA